MRFCSWYAQKGSYSPSSSVWFKPGNNVRSLARRHVVLRVSLSFRISIQPKELKKQWRVEKVAHARQFLSFDSTVQSEYI